MRTAALKAVVGTRCLTSIIAALVLMAYCAGCSDNGGPTDYGGPADYGGSTDYEGATDYASLIDSLRDAAAVVEISGALKPDLLSGQRSQIGVDESVVTVWEYDDDATADAEAKSISRTGSAIAGAGQLTMIGWAAPPHWYKAGTLIVLYVGENEAVIALLENVLGPQFAPR